MSQESHLPEVQRTIAFGMDVKAFMRTTLGQYLTQRANSDIAAAQDELLTVDAADTEGVRKLQNKAAIASCFLDWMGQAVTAGEVAQQEFIDAEQG